MKFKTALVTGSHGQVGYQLAKHLKGQCEKLILTSRSNESNIPGVIPIDLENERELIALIRDEQPQVIFNPAAYTAVDRAETERDLADHINRIVPSMLASEAKKLDALLVHYSTDYVFDGSGSFFRDESAKPAPLSIYGQTKLAGELAIQESGVMHLIFRTSWVFSDHGHNFVKTMLRLGSERDELKIVSDQIGSPTSAALLASAAIHAAKQVLGNHSATGLYHLCTNQVTSWYEFALRIFEEAKTKGYSLRIQNVLPISTHEYPTPAKRPLNSRLDCAKFDRAFGLTRPNWQAALSETLDLLI